MNIGQRLRELREAKGLSQRDIEKRTGMWQGYICRVERGHAPPNLVTLEKWAKALGLEFYQLFFEGEGKPVAPTASEGTALDRREKKLFDLFRRMPEKDKSLLLGLARDTVKMRTKGE
ncbi:MAG: helix-turn-helix domain-containing protein [Terriglobia bacterium]